MQTLKRTAKRDIASKSSAPKKSTEKVVTKKSFDDDEDDDDDFGAPLEDLDYDGIDRFDDDDDY